MKLFPLKVDKLLTLFETGPGSLSIQSQTFTALNYLQFSLETRWLGVIYLLTYLCFTSMLQWGRLKPLAFMQTDNWRLTFMLLCVTVSCSIICSLLTSQTHFRWVWFPFCAFTFVLKSLSLLGGPNSKAGKHTIVSLQWLMLANTFKPSLCDGSTAAAVQIMLPRPTLISCSDTRCDHSIDNKRLTWLRVCNDTLLMF